MSFSTWVDHLAFGYDIVAAVRPKLTVELGTQGGLSFFCFCQSLKENGGPANEHPLLKLLFDSSPEEHAELRAFYIHAGDYLELSRTVEQQERMKKNARMKCRPKSNYKKNSWNKARGRSGFPPALVT